MSTSSRDVLQWGVKGLLQWGQLTSSNLQLASLRPQPTLVGPRLPIDPSQPHQDLKTAIYSVWDSLRKGRNGTGLSPLLPLQDCPQATGFGFIFSIRTAPFCRPIGLSWPLTDGSAPTHTCLCLQVLLTGSTSKLGRAITLYLARNGVEVYLSTSWPSGTSLQALRGILLGMHYCSLVSGFGLCKPGFFN